MASGSEKRQRQSALKVRLTPAERATLDAAAERAGLSLAGYARSALLEAKPLRQSRRPPVARLELTRILGLLGLLGSNVNQIARALNREREVAAPELVAAAADILAMRAVVMEALGRSPGEDAP